jgi:glycosyltransferase involved in cell wall biosynthesis
MELTIVIPCYNEAHNLQIILPQVLLFCKENEFQLIIVNDGSVDNSKDVLLRYKNHESLILI